jgi:mono/diheme cytochrome c family protein
MPRKLIVMGLLAVLAACSGEKAGEPPATQTSGALTYYGDVLPIFEQHCLECHQQGGIAPFRLDQYYEAKLQAGAVLDATRGRVMPPWAATSDGSCQNFSHSLALADDDRETIAQWVTGGAAEGTPRSIELPSRPALDGATEFPTPVFSPVAQGGDLAEFDEYRCFLVDPGIADVRYITGYDVVPGTPSVIHHVLVNIVDPDAASDMDGMTNGEVMAALHAQSPDRDGWPCFGMAGDGVHVESVPVVWAPGQGVVEYPGDSGVPLVPGRRLVVQVHYNLADNPGTVTDQTIVRLRLTSAVPNVGIVVLEDQLLNTLFQGTPYALEPGKPSVTYSWQTHVSDYFGDLSDVKLYGLMPHMHQRGHKFRMNVGPSNDLACGMDVQSWDFHWQHMYFYSQPLAVTPDSQINVTCDFDTSTDTTPVLPGWGTRNEMCLAAMYFVVPAAELAP